MGNEAELSEMWYDVTDGLGIPGRQKTLGICSGFSVFLFPWEHTQALHHTVPDVNLVLNDVVSRVRGGWLIFVGHAHIPLLFGEGSDHACRGTEYRMESNAPLLLDPQDRYIVCVGAIGYSRDGIAKPRYVLYDAEAGIMESRAVDAPTLPLG